MIRKLLSVGVLSVGLLCVPAVGADFASLQWSGEFRLDAESGVTPKSVDVVNANNELNLGMTLETLVASADGIKMEGSSSFSGEFVIQQPHQASFPSVTVELRGHIIKTAGTTARLEVTIGDIKKTVEWKADQALSEPFLTTISAPIANGIIPTPFPVSAIAFVNKDAGSGAVLVSLEKIDVRIGQTRVASVQH